MTARFSKLLQTPKRRKHASACHPRRSGADGWEKNGRAHGPRRGTIFVVSMWVVIILAGLVVVFARSMRVEAVASGNRLSNVEAASVEHAAEQWLLCQVDGTMGDAVSMTAIPAQAIQVGNGYFWLISPNPDDDQHYGFGIQDESAKINLNVATDAMLVNVPDSTQEIADAIVTWRNPGGSLTGQAGGSGYYESLPEPYDNKSNNFETVEELLLLQNTQNGAQTVTKDILFGSDLNRDGVIDAGESQAAGGAQGAAAQSFSNAGGYNDTRGMYNFLTCYTSQPATAPDGSALINVNDAASRSKLQTLMLQTLSQSRVTQVLSQVAGTGTQRVFSSIGSWYTASGLQPQEFGPIASYLTAARSSSATQTNLLNVNTASRQALMCLPNLQESDADAIVSSRASNAGGITTGGTGITMGSSNSTAPNGDLSWLFQAVSNPTTLAGILPYVTYRSFQYSADIVAVSGDGRSFRRVRIVVDATNSPPVIVYRRDLTGYGWPLPPEIRTTMRQGSPPPIIQTTTTGGSGL